MDTAPSSFKRDQIRERIEKWVDALQKGYRQNIGLIGAEGLGKTCLLSSLFSSLSRQSQLITIALDAEALDYEHLVERWVESLIHAFFAHQNRSMPLDFQSALNLASADIPKTVEKIRRLKKMIRRGEKNALSARELFSLTGALAEETKKKILLMIDEFQALELIPASDPFALLGREIMIEKETLYLVTSSKPKKAREIFHDKLSLLFGNFEVVELSPFEFNETSDFLTRRQSGRFFSEIQKKFMIRMTDGIPLYLELLMEQLDQSFPLPVLKESDLNAEGKPEETPTRHLISIFGRELLDRRGRLALLFEKRLGSCKRFAKESAPYIRSLLAVSDGRRKVLGISTYIERKTAETKKILQKLVQEEIIVKRGSFYVLEDPLFRFWLREVFHRKNRRVVPDGPFVKEEFTRCLERVFRDVEAEEKADVTSRAEALFKEFRNDLVEVDHRKLLCPHFTEIAFRPSNGRLFPLFARKSNVRWVCQIARNLVHEEDIASFLEDLKRHRKKIQRRILVALDGIDQNAKLMAQEAEIQIWDLKNFNALLDLYNLPKIILMKGWDGSNLGALAQSLPTA